MDRFRLERSSRDDRFSWKNEVQGFGLFALHLSFQAMNSGCTNQKHAKTLGVLLIGPNAIRQKNPTLTPLSQG